MWHLVVIYSDGHSDTYYNDDRFLLQILGKALVKAKMSFSSILYDSENKVIDSFMTN